jgi:superfamily II DNA or RNA helicase
MRPPRPYQDRDAKAILGHLQRRQNPLYVLPTGGGKTWTFCYVTGTVVQHAHWHVGVFVHRVELLEQASDALAAAGIAHGIVAPGHMITSHHVHVASIDTVLARLKAGCAETARWLASLDMAVLDEAHHAVAGKWVRLAQAMSRALLFGVTATPYRTDGQGLGDVFNAAVTGPGVRDLIEDGWLTPFAVYAPPNPLLSLAGIKKRGGDYVQAELQRLMDTDALILPAVRAYTRLCPGTPAIGFCTGIDHAAHVGERFAAEGWDARSVDGTVAKHERKAAIRGLGTGALQVLTSCDIVSEGTDVPVVGAAIMLRPTASTGLYQQQVGRAARPVWPSGFDPNAASAAERRAAMAAAGKPHAIILDMVGVVATHGMPDEVRPWSLAGGIKGAERTVTATRQCRRCHRVHAWADTCPACGMAYPKAVARPGLPDPRRVSGPGIGGLTAEQVISMPLTAVLDHAKSPADVRRIREIRGYKDGWANKVIAEKFGIGQRRYGGWGR